MFVLLVSDRHMSCIDLPTRASCQIRKMAGCACAGNAGNVSPHHRFQRKPLVSDPGILHGTCVTHVPWCMSGSLTRGDGENIPGIPGTCAPAILRIWQEAPWIVAQAMAARRQSPLLPCYFFSYTFNHCYNPASNDLIKNLCNGRRSCTLTKSDVDLGDPCEGINKVISVDYECESLWYRYGVETFGAYLALFKRNPPVCGVWLSETLC